MTAHDCDVVVMGLGPGGEEVAGRLAEHGLDVVGVERELVGGECPYWGCIPTKMMVRATTLLTEGRRIAGVAGSAEVHPDFAPVAARIRREATDSWDDKVAVERLEKAGARFVRGDARLHGPGRVVVGDDTYTARRGVVVATGSAPLIPPVDGLREVDYWTNREAVKTEQVPPSLVVLGGGSIGLELCQMFRRYGSRVSVVEGSARVLPYEEPEACEVLDRALRADGVELHLGVHARAVRRGGEGVVVEIDDGTSVTAEQVLVATGRRARVQDIGLDSVGLDPSARALAVDPRMRAGERLWGVGDVTGLGMFTHLAIYQAEIAVADILGRPTREADYRAMARVTFTDPEVGSAGHTESAAREKGLRVRTGAAQVQRSSRGWIHGPGGEGVIKLVEDADRGVLVGVTSVGPWGGEVQSMLTLAVHAEVPTSTLRGMHFAFPTFHRGVLDALKDLESKPA